MYLPSNNIIRGVGINFLGVKTPKRRGKKIVVVVEEGSNNKKVENGHG